MAITVPWAGFSWAVSGKTMPQRVIVSEGSGSIKMYPFSGRIPKPLFVDVFCLAFAISLI